MRHCIAGLLMGCAVAFTGAVQAQNKAELATLDYHLSARELAAGVYVVEGDNADFNIANGCNIINTGFITTGEGVVVVNTGPSRRYGEQLRALIARTTAEPVRKVVQLNLHPDYFMGHQAFADVHRLATTATRAGAAAEAPAYETNLYRLCGDWMTGTEALLPDTDLVPGPWRVGQREFELREYRGHTGSDLVLLDKASGVAFVGGLAFSRRVPTTPHARVAEWQQSIQALQALGLKTVVPSHGPVFTDGSGLDQTRRYLQWLDGHFRQAAQQGMEMNELLRAPVPSEFRSWAAFDTEYLRNVAHLYPLYEREALRPAAKIKP